MEPAFGTKTWVSNQEYTEWLKLIQAAIPSEFTNRAPCIVVCDRGVSSLLAKSHGDVVGKMRSLQENESAAVVRVKWGFGAGLFYVEPSGGVWPFTAVTAMLPEEFGNDGCN